MRCTLNKNWLQCLGFVCLFAVSLSAQNPTLTTDDIAERPVAQASPPVVPAPQNTSEPAKKYPNTATVQSNNYANTAPLVPTSSASLNARQLFTTSFSAWSNVIAMRARFQITGVPQLQGNSIVEFAYSKPDRVHIKMAEMEAITIGKASYVKMRGEDWKRQKQANVAGTNVDMNPAELSKLLEFLFSQIKINAKIVGTEMLDGVTTNQYEIKVDGFSNKALGAAKDESLNFQIWIGAEDNLIRRLVFSSPDNKMQIVAELYDYNVPINIVAPI